MVLLLFLALRLRDDCREFLGDFVFLLLLLGHLLIFATASLRRDDLLERVVEDDGLGRGIGPMRAVFDRKRRCNATVVRSVIGLANELAGRLLQAFNNFAIELIVFTCSAHAVWCRSDISLYRSIFSNLFMINLGVILTLTHELYQYLYIYNFERNNAI